MRISIPEIGRDKQLQNKDILKSGDYYPHRVAGCLQLHFYDTHGLTDEYNLPK